MDFVENYKIFLKDAAEKVYQGIYRKKLNNLPYISSNIEAIDKYTDDDTNLLSFDLINDSTLTTILSLHELFDRVTDDEVSNCFCLTSNPFIHPINCLLSSAALGLSYFHHSLLATKSSKRDKKNFYNKQNLPKVTYLSLTGIYSEIDIDMINTFSDNVQTIVMYDENTGGPAILSKRSHQNLEEDSLREHEIHFQNISKTLLLIPLECSADEKVKSYSSNDILNLIMDLVIPSIAKFKPVYIVLNCSLIFDQNNKTPFDIDEATLAKIIQLLKLVADQKVIVYPFKLPTQTNHTLTAFNQTRKFIKKREQQQRLDYIFERYAIPYNETYLLNSFVNTIEALSGIIFLINFILNLLDLKVDETFEAKQRLRVNYLNNDCRHMIGRYYKTHGYYHFLHCKSYGPLARFAEQYFKDNSQTILNHKTKTSNRIPLLSKQGVIKTTKLLINEPVKGEVTLDYRSQYLVDYKDELSEPTIYIFNAKIYDQYLTSLKVPGPLSHCAIKLNEENFFELSEIKIISRFHLKNSRDSLPYLLNSGICCFETYVFQVYGTKFDDNDQEYGDSNEIIYFNFDDNKSHKLTVDKQHEILPRHSVTACAFKKDNLYFLYVFGGQVQAHTTWMNRDFGCLDVIDIVEIYTTDNLLTGQWQYTILSKSSLTSSKTLSFIPFKYSYAHYEEDEEKIVLMGGTTFKDSVYDWTFPVFEFDTRTNKFTSFDAFLNNMKGSLSMTKIRNDDLKTVVPEAIASTNKNFWFEKANRTFHFVVPSREDNGLVCYYLYNRSTSTCSFEHLATQSENSKKVKKSPLHNLKDGKQEGQPLSLNFQKEIVYGFRTPALRKALIEFIDYLFSINTTTLIDKTLIYNYLDVTIKKESENDGVYKIENETFEPILTEAKRTFAFRAIKRFLQEDENIEVFVKQDKQLEIVRSYLADKEQNSTKQTSPIMDYSYQDIIEDASASCEILFQLGSDQEEEKDQLSFSVDFDEYKGIEGGEQNIVDVNEKRGDKDQKSAMHLKGIADQIGGHVLDNGFLELESLSEDTVHIEEFKKSLTSPFNYHAFLNVILSEVKVLPASKQSEKEPITLQFKVLIGQKLVDFSFSLSPNSIAIYQGAIVCYVDQNLKVSHPQVYKAYKNWILFANIEEALQSSDKKSNCLVFKKLLPLCQEDCIYGRCLAVNNENLYLFGGKSIKYKDKTPMTYHNSLSMYSITKMKETLSSSIEIRDNEVDEMEYNSGECVMVYNSTQIFICRRKDPSTLEVFNNNGTIQTNVDFDISLKECYVHLNLVNFRGKEEILLTFYNINENMRFLLYDIENRTTESNVTLTPTEGEENVLSPLLYSGFEEIEYNSSAQPLKEIMVHNYRENEPKIVKYKISVTK